MTHEELIAALEAATEPSRDLDGDIAVYVQLPIKPIYIRGQAPFYTRSIDAALTLVPEPEATFWQLLTDGDRKSGYFQASVVTRAMVGIGKEMEWHSGKTPAIALCIAALKARNAA